MAVNDIKIFKYPSVGGEYNGMWAVVKESDGWDRNNDETLFRAKTRKECRQYCERNNLEIAFMDSGREHGCRW